MADAPDATTENDIPDVSLTALVQDAPVEDARTEAAETKSEADTTEAAKTPEGDESKGEASTEEAKPGEQSTEEKPAEDDKAAQAARARQEYQARQQRARQQFEKQIDQNYAPKSEEDLVKEGLSESDAKIEALRQEMHFERQKSQIAELNAGLQSDAVQVMHDYPLFDPNSPDYDEEFTKLVEGQYNVAARLQVDEDTKIVTNAEVRLYDFYEKMASIYSRGTSKGQQQGQTEALTMLSKTENTGGSSNTGKGDETLEEMEARLGDVRLV